MRRVENCLGASLRIMLCPVQIAKYSLPGTLNPGVSSGVGVKRTSSRLLTVAFWEL
jgi:hypothetical protein